MVMNGDKAAIFGEYGYSTSINLPVAGTLVGVGAFLLSVIGATVALILMSGTTLGVWMGILLFYALLAYLVWK